MSRDQTLVQLAQQISDSSKVIQDYTNLDPNTKLSFSPDGVERFPKAPDDIMKARVGLLDATSALRDLILGPDEVLKTHAQTPPNVTVVSWVLDFDIPKHVPLQGTISYENLSTATGIQDVDRLRRVLRYAMLLRIFQEPDPGRVGHSASSKLLATSGSMQAVLQSSLDLMLPGALKSAEAYRLHGSSTETGHSGWNVANRVADDPFYKWAEKHNPRVTEIFAKAVGEAWNEPARDMRYLLSGFDWQGLKEGAMIVDVGGNTGHVSIRLAETFPHLQFCIQDLPLVVQKGRAALPDQLKDRIQFMEHDFYSSQPVKDADIYLFHWVLLDHPDERAAKILQQIVPSMRSGAKIVIRDGVLLDPGIASPTDEMVLRKADISGMAMLNAGQRDMQRWKKVISSASPKLVVQQVNRPVGSALSVIVVGLEA